MPSSNSLLVSHICVKIIALKPESILDIGTGFGKYGFLAREYTDICHVRYSPQEWQTKIDGIEIFPGYIGDLQKLIYNDIYIGDALDMLSRLGNYDLILAIDLIEHLEKEKGLYFLRLVKKKAGMALIATPMVVRKQKTKYNNVYERHISRWTKRELDQFGHVEEVARDRKGVYLLEIKGEREHDGVA